MTEKATKRMRWRERGRAFYYLNPDQITKIRQSHKSPPFIQALSQFENEILSINNTVNWPMSKQEKGGTL